MALAVVHINGTTLFAGARSVGPLWQAYVRTYTSKNIAESVGPFRAHRGEALAEADEFARRMADLIDDQG